MKKIFFIALTLFTISGFSQVTKVSLQASGLTCSMCSNSINKAIRSLDFVDKIETNLKTSTFEISFKNNSKIDFDKLKKKVEDAGFSVANFVAAVQFNNVQVTNNQPVTVGDKTFKFINVKEQVLNGTKRVRLIDKGFISSKEFKKSGLTISPGAGKIYHATI